MEQDTYRGVTVPPALLPNEWELKWWRAGVDAAIDAALMALSTLAVGNGER